MKKNVVYFIFVLFLMILPKTLKGSGMRSDRKPAPQGRAERVLFTDSAGRQVEIPAKITRITASGSLAQMFLIAIAPDLLCTVTSAFPQQEAEFMPGYLANLPAAGQFYGAANINLEEIAAIGPEIVIDVGESKDTIAEDMDAISKAVAVPTVHIAAGLRSTPEAFRTLGGLLGRQEKGEALAAFCEKTLAWADRIMAQAGNNKKPALYCLGKQGLNVLAAGTFHTEVLDKLADNRAVVSNPASRGTGNETNIEQLLLWDPEVILFGFNSVYDSAGSDPVWRQMRAVRNGAYYEVPQGPHNWMGGPPSINRYLGMLWMLKIFYPEYADFDLYAEVAEYYRLFYSFELSQERFNALTARSLQPRGPAL
ncbi:MAG: ABC transporter substrate-binding protein [Treponema sp.]|nr:ABC transporter substrate-binding protein [Treponema sp.]